jgi:dihydroorotate dehydrogenase
MYSLLRNLLFLLAAEKAHHLTMQLFAIASKIPGVPQLFSAKNQPITIDGLVYKNKIGLAAGFDKDGKYLEQLQILGFGFVEVGTVTPKAQTGNPKPRLFRLKKDRALINRMGFNNDGVKLLKARLQRFRNKHKQCDMQIGINIGKNKNTPNENAVDDYKICYESLYDLADFFVVNVSSPNTPNLRELQNKKELEKIISALLEIRSQQETWKPLYLKIAPDLSWDQLNEIIELQNELEFEGLVATNTSIDRSLIKNTNKALVQEIGNGGLSGQPVLDVSNSFVQKIREKSTKTIIGVGGISDGTSAQSKIDAGANLIEIYTGFVYAGPMIVKRLASTV